ncbi:MAG: hypothetical protein QOG82_1893 [Actinomycetota bacterium]|jgi:dTDP-4-amino-4,6-dideoxygalactose transaminase|nr:hypothetical protein [Actinomycetota bacterium]
MTGERPSTPIRFQRPSFPPSEAIERYFARSRERHWYSNGGPCFELLAARLQDRTGCASLPVASATTGLIAAVSVLRRRRPSGTEAIVPSFTFAAAAQALVWNGLQPVFVDVDLLHWHLDADALRAALAARGSAVSVVVACSSFGTPPPPSALTAWESACRDAGVPLLVDSAAGFGAGNAHGVPVGAQGDAEVVSFHATKPFAIGEGGAVFSRDPDLVAEIARTANFAFDGDRRPQSPWGLNAKLDELHAATALAVLDGFDAALAVRRDRGAELLAVLGDGFTPQEGHQRGTFQFVPVLAADAALRDDILRRAAGRVELRTYYEPLHHSVAFAGAPRAGPLTVTDALAARMLSLPMFQDMTDAELHAIADVVSGDGGRRS